MSADGVAIVGMAGRFPGARDVAAFWDNIKGGVESITHFPMEELEIAAPRSELEDGNARFVCAKGLLDDVDMFDARFFGYLPREAELMDPQHRIFLELCWETIEHAGYDAQRYPGAIGVYGGCYMDTYLMWNLCSNPGFLARLVDSIQVGSLQTELGNDKDYLATRVAYKLGLRGPAMTLQTACSTSLVAIATACQSVASYQCDMALAGGVTLVLPQKKGYFYKEGGMLSPDGHCRTFDEDAAGTVFSNGAAVVLLKREADAIADGDTIYAVIRGYATNNDGNAKVSYTAPSIDGQADVVSMALAMADVDARTMGYVEAHGTATPIGDPIEIAGLTSAYRAYTPDKAYCAIGSVKANLGHLDVASGAIGVIKTSLALHEGVLPPSINFNRPNPRIDFASSPFYVNTQLRPWPGADWPRRAGVSSFGVGGTNAHVVLEQAPAGRAPGLRRSHSLLLLSARTETALAAQAARLADHLERHPTACLDDVAFTLQVGRTPFEHRRVLVASDTAEAAARLRGPARPGETGRKNAAPKVVFMFPGQGAQYPGMARELHAAEPVFRAVIERCCDALVGHGDCADTVRECLLWTPGDSKMDAAHAAATLAQTRVAQPAIFAMEMALMRLLESWGIRPSAVMGHSVGEFAAACTAGVFELEDAMRLVAARGELMQAQPGGTMLAVRAAAERVRALLPGDLAIAAENAPELTVVSGPTVVVEALEATFAQQGIASSRLVTSHAFHSSMMAPACAPLTEAVAAVARRPASVPIISTAMACALDADAMGEPDYWGRQLLQPVRFADSVLAAASDEPAVLLEVGPGQTLTTLARQTLQGEAMPTAAACLGPVQAPGSDLGNLLLAVGRLWLAGFAPDWQALQAGARQRVPLPTYPFERKRFWVEPSRPTLASARVDDDPDVAMADAAARVPADLDAAGAPAMADAASEADELEAIIRQQLAVIAGQIQMLASTPLAPAHAASAGPDCKENGDG
jgi:acyl transferase domain-containing protein